MKSQRISDGIVRLTFVAGDRAYEELKVQTDIVNKLCDRWGVEQNKILMTAERFFKDSKKLASSSVEQERRILNYQIKLALNSPDSKLSLIISDQPNPTMYFSSLSPYAGALKDAKKGIAFLGETFIIGLLGDPSVWDPKSVEQFLLEKKEEEKKPEEKKIEEKHEEGKKDEEEKKGDKKKGGKEAPKDAKKKPQGLRIQTSVAGEGKGKKDKGKIADICMFSFAGEVKGAEIKEAMTKAGFKIME